MRHSMLIHRETVSIFLYCCSRSGANGGGLLRALPFTSSISSSISSWLTGDYASLCEVWLWIDDYCTDTLCNSDYASLRDVCHLIDDYFTDTFHPSWLTGSSSSINTPHQVLCRHVYVISSSNMTVVVIHSTDSEDTTSLLTIILSVYLHHVPHEQLHSITYLQLTAPISSMKKTIQQKERSISYVISEAISGNCASLCEDHRSIDDYLDDVHYKA